MSGRSMITQSAQLREIPIYLMDAATGEGVTGVTPGSTGFAAAYRRAGETADTVFTAGTALVAVAASAAIAPLQWREYGRGWYTVVGSAGMYAAGARFVFFTVDCGTPAALADSVVVHLTADDFAAAAETSAGNSLTFLADLADSDGAAARLAIANAVVGAVDGRAIGGTSQPSGGSTIPLPITPVGGGTPTQRKRLFLQANGDFWGLTAIEAIP
jgi:hypothetical protein